MILDINFYLLNDEDMITRMISQSTTRINGLVNVNKNECTSTNRPPCLLKICLQTVLQLYNFLKFGAGGLADDIWKIILFLRITILWN